MTWKTIPGTNNLYQASLDGQIRRIYPVSGKTRLMTSYRKRNHYITKISDGKGNRKEVKTSHLVWNAFRGSIPKGLCVYHKNGLNDDHALINLQLLTKQEVGKLTGADAKRKPVIKVAPCGEIVDVYPSARAAARANAMSYQTVLDRCNLKVKNPFALDGHNYLFDVGPEG